MHYLEDSAKYLLKRRLWYVKETFKYGDYMGLCHIKRELCHIKDIPE